MDEVTIESLLLEIFGGNPYHARARTIHGDLSYQPVEIPLTIENITSHVKGEITLGSYQILQSVDQVKWLGWDVDSQNLPEAREVVLKIVKYLSAIPYSIEFSGSKGYHILVFLSEPMLASDAKRVTEWVREQEKLKSVGETHVECFPKQDRLTRDRPKGNLLKMPLGVHPRTHDKSRFVDIYNGWENGPDCLPAEVLQYRASPSEVLSIMGGVTNPMDSMANIIVPYWNEGNRHDLSLFLCGFLANEGWTIESTKDLIQEVCEKAGDADVHNRFQTVITTFTRFREGKIIRGRQGLAELLPTSAMQALTELSSLIKAPNTVLQIDEIRYLKGKAKIESVRLAASTIWSILNDSGCKLFQTENGRAFWYNAETHTVLEEGREIWDSLLNKMFGLNPIDNFSRMVTLELRLRIVREAPFIPIQQRTYWDEEKSILYVNMGGPEVYVLNGETIDTQYNGQCGHMFLTIQGAYYLTPDFNAPKVNAWDYLVEDLSFTTSADAPAKPAEQKELLKGWILSFFFQELMPTKPILALIGAPGSGKTTAIRRILRILEDPSGDVLGIPTDKQDAFRSSIEGHRLLVMDNLEKSGVWWMVDMLNKLATGTFIELRKLYHTNEIHMIIPKCFVALTAINIPFSDETLFSRLLVLEMQQLDAPLPEHILQKQIREYGPAIWADLLGKLTEVVAVLKARQQVKAPTRSRLADFTVFCERIRVISCIDGEQLSKGLLAMVDSQMKQLKESSIAILLLGEWIQLRPQEAKEWMSLAKLYEVLQGMAYARKKNFPWKSAQALYRHLSTLQEKLESEYQAEFYTENGSTGAETVKVRFDTAMI